MPAGRDARAASQSPLRSRSSSNTSSADRERLALKEQLAAWRARRDKQQSEKPATPTTPKPFRAMSSSTLSEEEKKALLQKRRELMRSPAKSPQRPKRQEGKDDLKVGLNEPGATPPSSASSVTSSIDSQDRPARPPPPQTPPRRGAHQDVHRPSRPAPPQTPPLAPRPPPQTPPLAPRPPPFRGIGARLSHGQEQTTQRLLPLATNEPVRSPPRKGPPVAELQQAQELQLVSPTPLDSSEFESPTPSPTFANVQAAPRLMGTDSALESTTSVQRHTLHDQKSSERALPPPILVSPPRLLNASKERGPGFSNPVGRAVQASPQRQVRFADEETMEHSDRAEDAQGPNDRRLQDSAHEESDESPANPFVESQSSLEREMMDREQLMSEVDELIYQHTEETVVTDRLVQRHTAEDDHDVIDERVLAEHSASLHLEEETIAVHRQSNEGSAALDLKADDQVGNSGLENGCSADRTSNEVPTQDDISSFDVGDSLQSKRSVRLHVVPTPVGKIQTPTPARRLAQLRMAGIASIILAGLLAFDLLYPQAPVSRGLRVTKRVLIGLASYLGSRATVLLWRNLIQPGFNRSCELLFQSNTWLAPRAKALQSLFDDGCGGLLDIHGHSVGDDGASVLVSGPKFVFDGLSSAIANALLHVASPLMRPLPTIDPETTLEAHNRLQELNEAQAELRMRVNDLLRTQEEWALKELERMKERRVAYATATKSILTETTKVMLRAVQDAKLSAAEHIQEFTDQLAHELMSSIQPELDEYERLEVDYSREQTQHDAALKKLKLEEAARQEVLRVESVKHHTAANMQDEAARDRKSLLQDEVFVSVDVMEVVETVGEVVQNDAAMSASTIAHSLHDTIEEAEALADLAETELEAVVDGTEDIIECAEKRVVESIVESLTQRKQELKREHDAAEAEIERLTGEQIKRLQQERKAAEQLARVTLLAEETLAREADEARRVLDAQLQAGKMELEQELANAADVAVKIETVEVEKIVIEEDVVKEVVESHVVGEVERLVRDVEEIEMESAIEVTVAKSGFAELEEVAESTLTQLAQEEVKELEREQAAAEVTLESVALDAERKIASSAGIQMPLKHGHLDTDTSVPLKTNASTSRSAIEETERRHMLVLSIGFVALALATAFVLYPRWRRLIAKSAREAKRMSISDRRRRRRSWQRPAQFSDSEPEEVTLLQTGSSSDDGLSDEPEPEVVELMSPDPPRSTYTSSTRTTYSSYSRALDFNGGSEDDRAHEGLASTPPTQRALRRRR